MKIGDIVYGKVTNILGYGAFVTEFSDNFVRSIEDFVKVGQDVRLRVIEIDEENKRLKLSFKQIHKTRGIRCRVPRYNIGFKSIEDELPKWINEQRKK